MYLKQFTITNFRGIKLLNLEFHKGLNILIGENNAGKTAIIDALRICLNYGNIQRDRYFNKDFDFFIDKTNPSFECKETQFDLIFEIENPFETSIYRELLNINPDGTQDLQLHFKYYIDTEKLRYKVWGGIFEGQTVTSEILQLINYIHLDALRDAEQHLRPYKSSKISTLYDGLNDFTKEDKKELANKFSSVMEDSEWKGFIEKGKEKINEHLDKTTFDDTTKKQKIEVTPTGFSIGEILNNLRIQIPVFDKTVLAGASQKYLDLSQNGLGYNNLIYISTILGDIVQQKEKEKNSFYSLLIEEPEAHLHPQLQRLFFNYLNELSKHKDFQIFVTSHSPTITAKADLDTLIILQSQNNQIEALPIRKSELSDDNKKYLQKFLDVTKSQLFFSNGTILVEGIAEALLMPIFAKIMGNQYDLDRNGIEVSITGISFEHFAKLYNGKSRVASNCAIITDSDRDLISNKAFSTLLKDETKSKKENKRLVEDLLEELENLKFIKYDRVSSKIDNTTSSIGISSSYSAKELEIIKILIAHKKKSDRAQNVKKLEGNNLKVNIADITFEYDLIKENIYNFAISLHVFEKLHPNVAKDVRGYKKSHNLEDTALFFLSKIGKSEFAYQLSLSLESNKIYQNHFKVPSYIQDAIKWVTKK
jgi:putative ATP-dependent endonuclease of the OLD family